METLLVTIAQLISMTCLILTIAVYLYVKQLRNVLGKCIISSLFCMFFYNLTTFHIYFEIKNYTIQFTLGYIYFFFVTAYNLWLSVISCYMWKMLTKLGIEESSHQFLKYSAFVWLTSFFYPVFLGLIYPLLVFAFGEELLPTVLSLFPLPIIYIFNAIMFILTAIHMVKVKRELNSFKERDETTTTCFNLDTQTFLQFTRISVLMGASWILDGVYFFLWISELFRPLFLAVSIYNHFLGIIIFVVLIMRRSTLKLVRESYHERRRIRQARSQRV